MSNDDSDEKKSVPAARPVHRNVTVTVTRKLPALVEHRLADQFVARLNPDDTPLSQTQLLSACRGSDVLLPTVTDRLDRELITALPESVRLIANFGAGVDHIDLRSAAERGIAVTNTPDVLTEDTADLTIALLLAAARRVVEGDRLIRRGSWRGWAPTSMRGARFSGKRLGILGMGRIGRAVAHRARGFGMMICYHNRQQLSALVEQELRATYRADLDKMLTEVDFLSVHCALTEETRHLLGARRLALLPAHAVLVNTARGGIVDERALIQNLRSGALAAAGLDVFENEPAITPELLELDNVVLAPHLGSATTEARLAMGERTIANIEAFAAGLDLPDRLA